MECIDEKTICNFHQKLLLPEGLVTLFCLPHLGSVSKQLFFISVLVFAISCHYSETGMVTGLKGQKAMYVICIFLKNTIRPAHTVAEYRCQKELAIKLILERHWNEEQKGSLPWLLVGCACLGIMPTILVYYFGSCYLSQARKYYLMINCVKWFRYV